MPKAILRAWVVSILWTAYCGGCILWGNVFAKTHINLSWFPTPIFFGELLLLVSIILTWPEIINSKAKAKRTIFSLSLFLFVVTAIGFIKYGPFALRHAATLAYIFFAFILYRHTVKGQILAAIGFMLYLIFLPIRFGFPGNEFYAFSLWALVCFALSIMLKGMNIKKRNYFICLTLFAVVTLPLYLLFHTSRTFIVANGISFLCLLSGIIMIHKASAGKKLIFLILCVLILLSCVYYMADRNALRSMFTIKETVDAIKANNQEYMRLKKDYKPKDVPVAVYRPIGVVDYSKPAATKSYLNDIHISDEDKLEIADLIITKVKNQTHAFMGDTDELTTAELTITEAKNQIDVQVSYEDKLQIAERTIAGLNQTGVQVSDEDKLEIADLIITKAKDQTYASVSDEDKLQIAELAISEVRSQVGTYIDDEAGLPIPEPVVKKSGLRNYQNAKQNILFRIFVWKGLFEDIFEKRAFLGFGLGKPFRPKTTQVLGWTTRLYLNDGWVSAHNSWFHLIYLFGILGVLIVLLVWFMWGHMFFRAVRNKDFWGIFLGSALVNFMVGAWSQPLLEQPHYAIFFWGFWGIVFRRVYSKKSQIGR